MQTQPEANSSSKAVLPGWWIAHPMIGFIGTMASVIGIPLGVYLYLVGRPTRNLTISSDPPVTIVKAGQASSVDVLFHGKRITTDVYVRQLYIWNAGTDSIRQEHVLEPIGIRLTDKAQILETRIRKITRALTNVKIEHVDGDTVVLSWSILEHDDGAAIDLIYTADAPGDFTPLGTIEHQSEIQTKQYESSGPATPAWERHVILGMFICLLAGCLVSCVHLIGRAIRRDPAYRLPLVLLPIIVVLVLSVLLTFYLIPALATGHLPTSLGS